MTPAFDASLTQFDARLTDGGVDDQADGLRTFMGQVRAAFDMDIVFISEFVDDRRVYRHIDLASNLAGAVAIGDWDPLDETYCHRVVRGTLPGAIPDAQAQPEAARLPITAAHGIRAHLTVPIALDDGRVFGTLCCVSRSARPGLGERELEKLGEVAQTLARGIGAGRILFAATISRCAQCRQRCVQALQGRNTPAVEAALATVVEVCDFLVNHVRYNHAALRGILGWSRSVFDTCAQHPVVQAEHPDVAAACVACSTECRSLGEILKAAPPAPA